MHLHKFPLITVWEVLLLTRILELLCQRILSCFVNVPNSLSSTAISTTSSTPQQSNHTIITITVIVIIVGTIGLILLIGSVLGYIRVISKIRAEINSELSEDTSLRV